MVGGFGGEGAVAGCGGEVHVTNRTGWMGEHCGLGGREL
jgi:hypothetical protein